VATAKEELRRSLRRVRESISVDAATLAAAAAARHLFSLAPIASARTVGLYAAIRAELDCGPVARELAARGVRLAYPRVVGTTVHLEFHEVALPASGPAPLGPGAFGIPEPAPSTPIVALDHIDVFLVPGLAFDRTGSRLGWGHGYYDRALARAPSAVRVGYCYAFQLVDHVPREADDLPMHFVVTDAGASPADDGDH
jgi:5-formyltetrahydrofolate cyclo-ligase